MIFKTNVKEAARENTERSELEVRSGELIKTAEDAKAELESYYVRLAEESGEKTEESARFHLFLRDKIASFNTLLYRD